MMCVRREAGAHRPAASAPSRFPSSRPTPPRNRSRPDSLGGRARRALLLPVLALIAGALCALPDRPAEAQTTQYVASGWQYVPSGITAGKSFRLLFVTSTRRNASSSNIADYNSFVQARAATNTHLSGFSGQFRALISTATVDARDNTATTGTGVPIYWLGGAKVADNYGDFYDGNWDSVTGKLENGNDITYGTVWTGSKSDGTKSTDPAGASYVVYGLPFNALFPSPWGSSSRQSSVLHQLYALSPVITVASAPAKPTGLSAAAGHARVALSWTDPNDASITKYQYQRKDGANDWGSWWDIPNSAPGERNAASYTVTRLSNGTAYRFRIRAVNAAGNGPQSDEATATPVHTTTAPSKPTGLTATAGEKQVTLSWTNPNDATITKYQYQRKDGANRWGTRTNIPSSAPGETNATSYTLTNLSSGTEYRFRIRALNARGVSAWSDVAGPATPTARPAKPAGFYTLAGDKQVLLGWGCPCDPSTTKHQYQQQAGSNAWGSWTDIANSARSGANAFSFLVTGLTNGTPYRFRIRAVNAVGAGPASDVEGPRTPAEHSLPALSHVRAWASGRSGEVTIGWRAPRNIRADKYQYRYKDHPIALFTPWQTFEGSTWETGSHTVTGLEDWRQHWFQVRAWNAAGVGPASAEARAIPGSRVVHGERFRGIVVEPGRDRIDLSWYVNRSRSGQTQYLVWWRETGATGWNIYELWSWDTHLKTTIAPREFWVRGGMYTGPHRPDNPESLKPGTKYDVRLYVGSGNTNVAPGLVYETTVSTTGTAPMAPPAAPALQWARVTGAELALRFDETLDASSVPGTGAFAVNVAGSARSVSSVSVSEAQVTLTLASAVTSGEAVTVGYTPPSTGKLRLSGGGTAVAAFSGQAVTNDTPPGQPQVQPPPETVEPPAADPLTARIASAPSEHRGEGRFELRVAFSDAVAGRAKDAAVQVSGGTLARAVRVNKRKDLWKLTVNPSGYGAVTVTLPATADCSAAGAVCTADGRKLETALSHTVQGPPALSVADARAREGAGATMDFAVTLSRAAAGEVTVTYATRNGTAKKGKDYAKAKGKLAFAPGETAKTVSVALMDDAHDEGAETFSLVLKKATGAAIADGEAVGTIENSDPLQKDWLARFGRAAAADAVAAVTERLETPRDAGSHLTLAGQRVDLTDTDGGRALEQALTGFAQLLGASPEAEDPDGTSRRWLSDIGPAAPAHGAARTIRGRELLLGTSFRAVLGTGAGSQWTSWGQGASVSQFSSATPSLSLSGEMATGSLGMDYEHGRLLTGFAMTHSLGEGTAQGSGRSYLMGSAVTTMLPYVRYALSDRLSAWGLAGTGTGRLTLDLDGGAPERYGADLAMTLAATGVRGELVKPAEPGGFALALKADAFWVRTESESVSTPDAGNLAGARADASRVRAVLDGSRSFALAGGGTLTPSVELGLRRDGGDAETGTGYELGAGLGYADPSRGLDMALRLHGLAGHAEDGYAEWGVSGSLRLVPGAADRGLSASLTPSYGVDPGGTERLWALPDAHALDANEDAPLSRRLDAELGYGMAMFGGGFTGTPNVGMGLSDTARELRMGWRLAPADGGGFQFHLDAARRDAVNEDAPEHRIGVGLTARW